MPRPDETGVVSYAIQLREDGRILELDGGPERDAGRWSAQNSGLKLIYHGEIFECRSSAIRSRGREFECGSATYNVRDFILLRPSDREE